MTAGIVIGTTTGRLCILALVGTACRPEPAPVQSASVSPIDDALRARAWEAEQRWERGGSWSPDESPDESLELAADDAPDPRSRRSTGDPLADAMRVPVPPPRRPATRPQGLPLKPTVAEIKVAIATVRPDVDACFQAHPADLGRQPDKVVIKMTIDGPSGGVTSAAAVGRFSSTALGGCIASALLTCTFQPFAKPRLSVQYPFRVPAGAGKANPKKRKIDLGGGY